jgi:hypothetical protein
VRLLRPLLIFLLPLLVYLATGNTRGSSDSRPARYLPFSLVREGNFDLDEFKALRQAPFPGYLKAPYYLRVREGHYVSAFSPGPALLALPVYALPVLAGASAESDWPALLEKASASFLTALSVLFVFLAARRASSEGPALAAAAIYAFATSSFSVSSQALWEHGPGQLCLAIALWLLTRGDEDSLPATAFALSGAVLMRPPDLLVAAPLFLLVLLRAPRHRGRVLLLSALPLLFLAAYDTRYFGAPWSTGRDPILRARQWALDPLPSLAGLLVSPSRGLLVYSPVLVFAFAGLVLGCLRRRSLFAALAASTVLFLWASSLRHAWWGGWCYGPRYLADLLPVLCFALLPVLEAAGARPWLRAAVLALALPSVALHALGAVYNDLSWDGAARVGTDAGALWSWSDGPIPHYARRPLASLRRAQAGLRMWLWRPPTSAEAGGLAAAYVSTTVPGTALAGHPLEVRVTAFNTGRSVWLAPRPESAGVVRLAWSWACDGRELPEPAGRLDLAYPVFPGESFAFRDWIRAPGPARDCIIALGLVSEDVAWFADQGTPPLRIPLRLGVRD